MSRTCRAFMEPALDELWKRQTSLHPLLKCLPNYIWEEKVGVHHTQWGYGQARTTLVRQYFFGYTVPDFLIQLKYFRKGVGPTDLSRLQYYAPRIKELRKSGYQFGLDVTVCSTLEHLCESLLPCLRVLHWEPESNAMIPTIRLLIGPSLRTLDLSLSDGTTETNLAVISMLPAASSLREFTLYLGKTSEVLSSVICEQLHQWGGMIESVHFGKLANDALIHVARLPSLRHLTFRPAAHYNLPTSPPAFTSLRNLRLTQAGGQPITFCTSLLRNLSSCPLETISVCVQHAPAASWIAFFLAMSKHLHCPSLMEIAVEEDDTDVTDIDVDASTDFFLPLLTFTNLTDIDIHSYMAASLDDNSLAQMAIAWRRIQKLSFTYPDDIEVAQPKATIRGLMPFAQYCRDLQSLSIEIDANTITDLPSPHDPSAAISNHITTTLNVRNSPILSPPAVAAYLSGIFPGITKISTLYDPRFASLGEDYSDEEVLMYERWHETANLIKYFTAVRKQGVVCAHNQTNNVASGSF